MMQMVHREEKGGGGGKGGRCKLRPESNFVDVTVSSVLSFTLASVFIFMLQFWSTSVSNILSST